ncbi:MAG: glycosyltransferase family 4 protein [Thermoproteota archaeon]
MKVALLFHALTVKGGSPRLFLSLANSLSNIGHDVHVYAYVLNEKEIPVDLRNKVDINAVLRISDSSKYLTPNLITRLDLAKDYFLITKKWAKSIRENKFDIINAHEALSYKAALELKRREKCPVAWYVADPASYVNKIGDGRLYDRSLLFKILLNIFAKYDKQVIRKLDRVMIPNHKLKKVMDAYYGIQSEVIRISGVDTKFFVPKHNQAEMRSWLEKEMNIPSDSTLTLSVSIHMQHRRFEDAITAVANLNKKGHKIHYLIVGSSKPAPDYTAFLRDYISRIGANGFVHFIDSYISETQLLDLYNACDIFLFPNNNQTWGLAPFEAMSVGKPVIVTTGAGVHEVLKDGENAFIVNPMDSTAMSEKIETLVVDGTLRCKIAMRGREFVNTEMTWEKCAKRLVDSFSNLQLAFKSHL